MAMVPVRMYIVCSFEMFCSRSRGANPRHTADRDGHYAAFGKDRDGVTQRMRADDGIHFTAPGYELIAGRVLELIPPPPTNMP